MGQQKTKAIRITDGQIRSMAYPVKYKLFPEDIIVYPKEYHYIGVLKGCGFVLSISNDQTLAYIYALRRLELICGQNNISAKKFSTLVSKLKPSLEKVDTKTFYDVLFQKQNLSTINNRRFKIDKAKFE
jgi:hypothetical protein